MMKLLPYVLLTTAVFAALPETSQEQVFPEVTRKTHSGPRVSGLRGTFVRVDECGLFEKQEPSKAVLPQPPGLNKETWDDFTGPKTSLQLFGPWGMRVRVTECGLFEKQEPSKAMSHQPLVLDKEKKEPTRTFLHHLNRAVQGSFISATSFE